MHNRHIATKFSHEDRSSEKYRFDYRKDLSTGAAMISYIDFLCMAAVSMVTSIWTPPSASSRRMESLMSTSPINCTIPLTSPSTTEVETSQVLELDFGTPYFQHLGSLYRGQAPTAHCVVPPSGSG